MVRFRPEQTRYFKGSVTLYILSRNLSYNVKKKFSSLHCKRDVTLSIMFHATCENFVKSLWGNCQPKANGKAFSE
jgi:hypothetical protein